MSGQKWEWGTVSTGIYRGMLWATIPVAFANPNFLLWYCPLLFFLGLCLKPLLEVTGLSDVLINLPEKWEAKRWRKVEDKVRREIRQKQRDAKYRNRRVKDPRLPKNW